MKIGGINLEVIEKSIASTIDGPLQGGYYLLSGRIIPLSKMMAIRGQKPHISIIILNAVVDIQVNPCPCMMRACLPWFHEAIISGKCRVANDCIMSSCGQVSETISLCRHPGIFFDIDRRRL